MWFLFLFVVFFVVTLEKGHEGPITTILLDLLFHLFFHLLFHLFIPSLIESRIMTLVDLKVGTTYYDQLHITDMFPTFMSIATAGMWKPTFAFVNMRTFYRLPRLLHLPE